MRFQLAATTGLALVLGLGMTGGQTSAQTAAPKVAPGASPTAPATDAAPSAPKAAPSTAPSGPVILPLQPGAAPDAGGAPNAAPPATAPQTVPDATRSEPARPAPSGPEADAPPDEDADGGADGADFGRGDPNAPPPPVMTGGPLGCVAAFADLDRDGDGFLSRTEAPEVTVSTRIDPVTLQDLGVAREDFLRSCSAALDASDPIMTAPPVMPLTAPPPGAGAPATSPPTKTP